jgi:hypothetical protein
MVRAYREFLIRATASKWMDRLEGILNYVCPKSIIVYGEKRVIHPAKRAGATQTRSVEAIAAAAA